MNLAKPAVHSSVLLLVTALLSSCVETNNSKEWSTGWIDGPSGPSWVSYQHEPDGTPVYGSDILIAPSQMKGSGDSAFAAAVVEGTWLWPNGVVPVVIRQDARRQDWIQAAITHWNQLSEQTGVRIVQRTTEANYIEFVAGTNCSSFLGRIGGKQPINTVCQAPSSLIHELGHAIGLAHEHQRPDRSQHLRFFPSNASEGVARQLAPSNGITPITPFDFNSVMLYSSFAGANGRGPVFTTIDGELYERGTGLSELDIFGIASMYGGSAADTEPDPAVAEPVAPPKEPETTPAPQPPTRCDGIEDSGQCVTARQDNPFVNEYLVCGNGLLAPSQYRCDGDNDCGNGYDEFFCESTFISPVTIELIDCQNGYFIEKAYLCDGYNDCISNADESSC